MIEMNNEEVLELLMTSDFEDNYKPEDFRELLIKFRYFYRLKSGKLDVKFSDLEECKLKNIRDVDLLNRELTSERIKSVRLLNTIDSMKNRNLTWKERISGKIILKEDEN